MSLRRLRGTGDEDLGAGLGVVPLAALPDLDVVAASK
jgi:hypothetical protein